VARTWSWWLAEQAARFEVDSVCQDKVLDTLLLCLGLRQRYGGYGWALLVLVWLFGVLVGILLVPTAGAILGLRRLCCRSWCCCARRNSLPLSSFLIDEQHGLHPPRRKSRFSHHD